MPLIEPYLKFVHHTSKLLSVVAPSGGLICSEVISVSYRKR